MIRPEVDRMVSAGGAGLGRRVPQREPRKVLDEILVQRIREPGLIRPLRSAKDAVKRVPIRLLEPAHRRRILADENPINSSGHFFGQSLQREAESGNGGRIFSDVGTGEILQAPGLAGRAIV